MTTPQTLLDGNSIPKFVDPLPTFNGRRINGSVTLNVNMQEFQQRVLPASVYAGRPAPFNAGTFLWGYNINNTGASWPARTIEVSRGTATTAIYTNNLRNTRLQSLLTVDQTIHWADPLGTTARNNCVNGPPLAGPCTQPYSGTDPRGRAPARRRGSVAVRRQSRRMVHAGFAAARARLLHQHVQLRELARGDDALVPRPRARRRALERLCRPRGLLFHPRQP